MSEPPDDDSSKVVPFTVVNKLKAPAPAKGAPETETEGEPKPALRESAIDTILAAGVTFFKDVRNTAFAVVPRADRLERFKVKGSAFRHVVRRIYGDANQRPRPDGGTRPQGLPEAVVAEVVLQLETFALVGPTRPAELRSLREGDDIWVDLGDDTWAAVRLTKGGWEIVRRADVGLYRADTAQALPVPVRTDPAARADTLSSLRRLLNLPNDDALKLVVAWMVAALWPTGPYPILAIDGEQGSAKSSTARAIRRLTDPSLADLRAPPRNEEDLLIAGENGRVVGIDNVSYIAAEMADAICRLSTGSGMGRRRQYKQDEEQVSALSRPVITNGIPSQMTRGDFADRSIAVTLPAIPDQERRAEADLAADFASLSPSILGLLLDAMVAAMRTLPGLRLPNLPRMADFALLAYAAAPAFGWTGDAMLECLERNRHTAALATIDDPFGEAVVQLAASCEWSGTAGELLEAVAASPTPLDALKSRSWPKDATRLAQKLRRIAPAMRLAGVDVGFAREGGTGSRLISLSNSIKKRKSPSPASQTKTNDGIHGFNRDARGADALSHSVTGVTSPASHSVTGVTQNPLKTNNNDSGDSCDADSSTSPRDGVPL